MPGEGTATPATGAVNDRLLQIWSTPQGLVKAARKAGAATKVSVENGVQVITFPLPVAGMTAKVTLNAKKLIDKVEIRSDNPALGDRVTEITYSEYADYNQEQKTGKSDVLFPGHIVQKQGGVPVLDLRITETDSNNPYAVMPVPASVE